MTSSPESTTEAVVEAPDDLVRTAIARRRCIVAVYNRTQVKLAPHALYTKHGEPFVDAVTVERDGAKPKEIKLGAFKLSGLTGVGLTTRLFSPRPDFDQSAPRYEEQLLCAISA
ncbi:MAG: hypothetical protein JWO65_2268 [Sphingomonas bacterium]|nr:hypothetical protein [Sphingomonas bacterium]